jgi:hypothetical protein
MKRKMEKPKKRMIRFLNRVLSISGKGFFNQFINFTNPFVIIFIIKIDVKPDDKINYLDAIIKLTLPKKYL